MATESADFLDPESQELVGKHTAESALELFDAVDQIFVAQFENRSIPYEQCKSDDLMVLSYLTKQREHLRSARVLLESACHRDALLISRTMFEGYVQLRWALRKVPDRTDLWLYFGAVRDLAQMERNELRGIPVDPDEKREIADLVDKHGHKYLTDQAARALRRLKNNPRSGAKIPERRWRENWTDTSLYKMVQEFAETHDTYNVFYGLPSEWVHWDPRTILRAADMHEGGTRGFYSTDWRAAGKALVLSISSALECLTLLDQHYSLGMRGEIHRTNERLSAILQESLAQAQDPHTS